MPAGNGLLRSLSKSVTSPVETAVTGKIPSWVVGTLYRNGPGRYEYGQKEYKHLFDGHSCVHKFKIEDGKCWYSNKLLETKSYTKAVTENRLYPVFGTQDICSNLFGRIKAFFANPDTSDNTNVNVMPYGNQQLYALTETNYMTRLDPKNLNIMDTYNVSKYMDSVSATFAHPHITPDGGWITMGRSSRSKIPYYKFLRYKSGSNVNENTVMCEQGELIAKVESTTPSGFAYFHSFGLSENYIIYLEHALKIKIPLVLKNVILRNRPISEATEMDRTTPTRIHVINRHTGEIVKQKYVTEPLFTFHHINAFEQGKELVVDICSYDGQKFDIHELTREKLFSDALDNSDKIRSIARRISIPLDNKETDKEIFCDIKDLNSEVGFELPVINYASNNCKPYRYIYGTNIFHKPFNVVKLDLANKGKATVMTFVEKGREFLPTEAIFVPNPEAKSEDDGVLLVMCLSDKNDFLSVLDAKDLTEIARADVPSDVKGSFTFHGFFADKQTYPKLNI